MLVKGPISLEGSGLKLHSAGRFLLLICQFSRRLKDGNCLSAPLKVGGRFARARRRGVDRPGGGGGFFD